LVEKKSWLNLVQVQKWSFALEKTGLELNWVSAAGAIRPNEFHLKLSSKTTGLELDLVSARQGSFALNSSFLRAWGEIKFF